VGVWGGVGGGSQQVPADTLLAPQRMTANTNPSSPSPTPTQPRQLHELFESVSDEAPPAPGQDISAEQWLRSKGATAKQLAVAGVCYANDFGCSLQQLGLREMIVESNKWVSVASCFESGV